MIRHIYKDIIRKIRILSDLLLLILSEKLGYCQTLLLAQVYKQKDKFCSSALIFAGTANFFSPTWKLVVVAYSDQRDPPGPT